MNTKNLKEEQFRYFLQDCLESKSARNYVGGLKKVSKTLHEIDPKINSVWDIESLQDGESYLRLLLENDDFIVYNNENGNNMYSSAFKWYLRFLKIKAYFSNNIDNQSPDIENKNDITSLQVIYYGAPGTGKSDTITKTTNPEKSIRTTFHPDSDYSTFVGVYKPSMDDNHIVYKFIPQAFLKAYVAAWKAFADGTDYYLIIEEINRGNCAQIFGDLFQLLDRRDDGFSTYPISPDNDIRRFLANDKEGFLNLENIDEEAYSAISRINLEDSKGRSIVKGSEILSGEKLILPPNLFIWATMNTSDQSLFPIDSAFKRRWDWKYIRIKEGKDKEGKPLEWQIDLKYDKAKESDSTEEKEITYFPQTTTTDVAATTEDLQTQFDWWQFVKAINRIIASMTSSSDKQLGYFFCKANKDGVIDGQTFVGKVLFYLWNDVFKDYGFDDPSLFQYKSTIEGKTVDNDLAFEDFYDEDDDEKINVDRVSNFISKVLSWEKDTKKSDY